MLTFQKILFPVDFSQPCLWTAPYVAGIANKFGGKVTLLHALSVYDPFGYGATSSTVVYGTGTDTLRDRLNAAMADFGHGALDGFIERRVIEDGDPAECVALYARKHQIDLIVLPTHGYKGLRRLLLGSVTAGVLHKAECPVWTTAHSETLDQSCSQCIHDMVCAVDLSADSARIIENACELAHCYGASLQLIHAIPSVDRGSQRVAPDAAFQQFLIDTASEKIAALQAEMNTHWEVRIAGGSVASLVRDAALASGASLAITGRGHVTKLLGSICSNVNVIVRESPCPVLRL